MNRKTSINQIQEHILGCDHSGCRATRRLQDAGARLVLGKGRHCEIAVIAAAGQDGMDARDVVTARRAYAAHLGIELGGDVSDGPTPNHIHHAIEHPSHKPNARSPINLGDARAVQIGTRYAIRFGERQ